MHSTILRRMAGGQTSDAAEMPLTSSRAVRLALTKSANDAVGLVLTVVSMDEDLLLLDNLLESLDDTLMLIGLDRTGKLSGILAIDMQMRAAVMEMQTVGKLIATKAEDRKATRTDKTMCEPVLDQFLSALPQAMAGTEFDGWVDGIQIGQQIDSSRAAGLILQDHDYRILRLTIDLGIGGREGHLLIALPLVPPKDDTTVDVVEEMDWDTQFQASLAEAPVSLDALLHRFSIPLLQAENLQVGQVLPLTGCTVNSVRIISPDGQKLAQAKLGQMGGMRAVRIETAPAPQMAELGGGLAVGLPDLMSSEETASSDLVDPTGFGAEPMPELEDDPLSLGEPGPLDMMADGPIDEAGDFPMMGGDALSLMDET